MGTTSGEPLGRRLGDFEIGRELGRGGMGVVFEARQIPLNRKVALKVLGAGLGLTQKAVQRFHREAEAAAKKEPPQPRKLNKKVPAERLVC